MKPANPPENPSHRFVKRKHTVRIWRWTFRLWLGGYDLK